MAAIEVEDLHRTYRTRKGLLRTRKTEVHALRGITFEVERGELFGLLGPNGAGKTTTILMLLGLAEPTAGRAEVVGLDPVNAQALKDTVVDLKRRGKTVIFSTHIMDNAERLCDSVCIIARGEKVLDGAVADVKAAHGGRHVALGLHGGLAAIENGVGHVLGDRSLVARADDQNRFVELELAPGANPQELLRRLVAAGAPITRFELVQPSLHQIFLEKVGAAGVETGMSGHG